MVPPSRRGVLRAITTGLGVLASGCLGGSSDGSPTVSEAAPTATTGEDRSPASTTTLTTTRSDTETPVFRNLSLEGLPSTCPTPEPFGHHETPHGYPTPTDPNTMDTVAFATRVEAVYIDNWGLKKYRALDKYTPLPTPTRPESPTSYRVPDIEYPEVSASYETRRKLQEAVNSVVVHLQYERILAGESVGRYTVNHYIAADAVARAETAGYTYPGPHPTEDGQLLSCFSE